MPVLKNKKIVFGVLSVSLVFFLFLNIFSDGGVVVSRTLEAVLGEIAKCPKSPNCVSTLTSSSEHRLEPWSADSANILRKVKTAALKEPKSKLISESETHLQFTFKSPIFRFVDDVWFAFKDGKVHFKSAARTGYKDFNKNQERMERIKERVFD